MQAARGRAQERVQHVLPRLHERRALLPVPRLPPRPPRHPDTEVLLPRRDPGVGDSEGAGHHRRADLHHQQRARGVPERAPAAEARQGRHQHLRGLRAQPPRHLPLLLPRLQDRRDLRRLPRPEEARRRQEAEEEAGAASAAQGRGGGGVGLGGRLVHQHQRRQRQEQRGAELHPVHPAGDRQQLPHGEAAQGRAAPVAVRQPHGGVLDQKGAAPIPPEAAVHPTVAYALLHIIYRCLPDRPVYIHSQPKGASSRSKQASNNQGPRHARASGRDEEAGAMRHVRYGYFHSIVHAVHCTTSNNGLGLVPLKGDEVVVAVTLVVISHY